MARWSWIAALTTLGCVPGTESGGEIVDTDAESGSGDTTLDPSGTMSNSGNDSTPSTDPTQGSDTDASTETGAVASCIASPMCGDLVIGHGEECEGDVDCGSCSSVIAPTAFVEGGGGIHAAVIGSGGPAVGVTQVEEGANEIIRYWDADGEEVWTVELDPEVRVVDTAFDEAGNVYATGSDEIFANRPNPGPWFASWSATGEPRWTSQFPGNPGWLSAIAVGGDRVIVAGGEPQDDTYVGTLRSRLGYSLLEEWTVHDENVVWIDDVVMIGDEVAAIGATPSVLVGVDGAVLVRYDGEGARLWSMALPDDGEDSQRGWGVIADGVGGTWTFGKAMTAPYAVHHDRDANVLEVIDCIGGGSGWVEHAALRADGALALAIQLELHVDDQYVLEAWFPVIENGDISGATWFDSDTSTAGPFAVGWRASGELVLGWTNFGSEGGPGDSQLALAP